MKIIKIICFIISLIILFNLAVLSVQAKTIINQTDECTYKVEVKIVFDFKYNVTQPEAERILTDWYRGMNSVWNGVYGSTILGNQCFAQYDFQLVKMHDGKQCSDYPDWHCIDIVPTKYNQRGNLADAYIVAENSEENSWGEWSKYLSPLNAAHEAGHMMGLSDEYQYQIVNQQKKHVNTNYKQTGPQSIMAQTQGFVAALKEHTLQILRLAEFDI